MSDGFGHGNVFSDNIVDHLCRFVGETVTIFTTSGGQSGAGFTGVILFVNPCFVRLITCIGPAPGCALGNSCEGFRGIGGASLAAGGGNRCCGAGGPVFTVGSVTDIPTDRIAAFVHSAV